MRKISVVIMALLILMNLGLTHILANNTPGLPDGYLSFQDLSDCPVKIVAYRIDYSESGETTVRLLLKNTANLHVVGFQGTFELFNAQGKPVDSIQGEPVFIFKDRTTLAANPQPQEGVSFVVEEGRNTKTVKPRITQVLFEDQSIWRGF